MAEVQLVDARDRPLAWARAEVAAEGGTRTLRADAEGRIGPLDAPCQLRVRGATTELRDTPYDGVVRTEAGGWPAPVVGVLVAAVLVRLVALAVLEPTPLFGDEHWYHRTAHRLVRMGLGWLGDPDAVVPIATPPVVPALYALVVAGLGDGVRALRLVNVAAGALLVLPVFRVGRAVGGAWAGLAAAALVALHPDLVAYAVRLWTEPVYLLVVWTVVAGLVDGPGRPTRWRALALGAGLGAAALVRESGLALPLVAGAWALLGGADRPARLRALAPMALGAALVVLPWTARLRADPLPDGLVARSSAFNLYLGNVGANPPYAELADDEAGRHAVAVARVREVVQADPVGWLVRKTSRTLPRFLGQATLSTQLWTSAPGSPTAARTRVPALESPSARRALAVAAGAVQAAVIALGAAGLVLAGRRRAAAVGVLVALFLATWAPVVVTFAKPRFALAAIPVFLVGAGLAIRPGTWRTAPWPARVVAVAAAVAAGVLATREGPW